MNPNLIAYLRAVRAFERQKRHQRTASSFMQRHGLRFATKNVGGVTMRYLVEDHP